MKRILYIHHAGGIGGAPLSLLYLLQQLDPSRYEPIIVTAQDGPVVDLYRSHGIETYVEAGIDDFSHTTLEWYGGRDLWRLPGKVLRVPRSIQHTRAIVERLQPDLVHLNSSTLAPSAIGTAQTGVPIVWHIREPLAHGYLGLRRRWIQRTVDQHGARIIAICQNDADQLIPSNRIHIIYNFVHFDQFDRSLTGESIRAEFNIPTDTPVVTFLGGVSEPKGTLTLVRAMSDLVQMVPGVRVIAAGLPPRSVKESGTKGLVKQVLGVNAYQKTVQHALDNLDRSTRERLIFTGIRHDIPDILAASTCLVFPSSVPHFARPIIEAAAMGLPAIASDLGGPRELIVHKKTGLLIPPRNPAALAASLADMLRDPECILQMGTAAYERARSLFDVQQNAAATIAIYDELLV